MKINKFKRALSVLLVAVMVISTLPLNTISIDEFAPRASANDSNSISDFFSDLIWEIFIKPNLKPSATVKGLPENANVGFDTVIKQYDSLVNGKNGSPFGTIVDMFDIKAVDKTTGEEIHPTGEFEITVKDVAIKPGHNAAIWHILDNEEVIRNADNVIEITDAAFVSAFSDAAAAAEKATGKSGVICVELIDDIERSGQDLTFKTDSFSIYVISDDPRIKVSFRKDDSDEGEIYSVYVKASDVSEANIAKLEQTIHEAPVDVSEYGENLLFRGWSSEFKTTDAGFANGDYVGDGAAYTAESNALTIEKVRLAVKTWLDNNTGFDDIESSGSNKVTLNFYTMLFYNYVITYFDENGNVCLGRDSVLIRADAQKDSNERVPVNYQLNITYVPEQHEGSTVAFLGWNLLDGSPDSETDNDTHVTGKAINALLGKEEQINIYGNVFVSAHVEEGHWLTFDENGKGATYNAPQFVKTGEVTAEPTREMKRFGYMFGGWFDTKAHADAHADDPTVTTGQFTFGGQLTENTTIYASWIPNETANYTIIIWKQNVDGESYDFVHSVSLSGNVGDVIDGILTTTNSVTIVGDSTTIVGYRVMSPQPTVEGDYWIDYNGQYQFVHLYRYYNRWYLTRTTNWYGGYEYYEYDDRYRGSIYEQYEETIDNTTYSYEGFDFKEYDQGVVIRTEGNSVVNVYFDRHEYTLTFRRYENSGTVYKTITALYGQYIGDNFPISVNGDTTYRWEPHNSSVYSQVLVYIDIMPAENTVFTRNEANYSTKYMEFYVEVLPGQTGTRTWNGKNFVKFGNTIPAKYNFFTEAEDFLEFNGLNKFGSDPAFSNGQANVSGGGTIRFYYTRKVFDINYMDGKYIDGDLNPVDEASKGQLKVEEDILYGANLASYNKNGANYYEPVDETGEYVFEGWYLDDACTHPYTFTTMPDGGITVYAKWVKTQYRVFLHPNAENDPSLDWGSESQTMNFRVSYGDDISIPNGRRTGYQFVGWFTDPECTKPYAESTKLNEDTVKAAYNKSTDMTDPMDKWGNLGDDQYNSDLKGYKPQGDDGPRLERFWITKKLDLYGLWRKDLGDADGVKIEYYAYDSESGEYKLYHADPATYLDTTLSYGLSAPGKVTKTVDDVEKTYYFKYWVEQAYITQENNTTGGFRPEVVLGAEPTLVDGARIIYPGEKFYIKSDYGFEKEVGENKYLYKHIVAVYVEAEPAKTTVKYDKNGGEWALNNNAPKIDGVNVTRNDTVITYQNSENQTVNLTYTEKDNGQYGFEIEVNKSFDILSNANETYVSREGYKFLGWATQDALDLTPEQFKQALAATAETDPQYAHRRHVFKGDGSDPLVAADTLDDPNNRANTLYAMWEVVMVPVEIKKDWVDQNDIPLAGSDTFTVGLTLDNNGVDVQGHGIEDADGNAVSSPITLAKSGEGSTKTVYVPYGTKLTVNETGLAEAKYKDPQYAKAEGSTGLDGTGATYTITGTHDQSAGTILVKNEIKTYTVKIVKTITNTFAEGTTFSFVSTLEGHPSFTLGIVTEGTGKNNELEVTGVKYGTVFTVDETPSTLEFTNDSKVINGEYTTQNDGNITVQGDVTVTFTNTAKFYTVTIKKELDNKGVNDSTWNSVTFPINYTVYDKNGNKVGEGTAYLSKDGTTTVNGVPFGGYVTVNEGETASNGTTIRDLFDVEITNNSVKVSAANANEDGSTSITTVVKNTRKVGKIIIEKQIENAKAAEDYKSTEFEFTVSTLANKLNISTVTAEADRTVLNVPYGLEVTITETPNDLFTTTNDHGSNNVAKVTLSSASETVVFTNERKPLTLTIKKTVNPDTNNDTGKDFYFDVEIGGVKLASQTVVEAGGTATVPNIPYGASVKVTEDTTKTYENGKTVGEIFEPVNAQTVEKLTNDSTVLTFNNVRKTAKITIEKKIENAEAAKTYKTREFTFTSNQWTGNKKITSQTPETITVPVGTTVTVTEQADDLFTTTNSAGGTYTAEITPYKDTTVTFTNTRKSVTVKVIKELDNKGVDDVSWKEFGFPMNYTVDGTAKPAIPVAPGATGSTFTVPFGSTVTLTEAATKDNVNIAEQFDVEYYEGDTKVDSVEFTADDDTPVIKVKNIRKTFTVTVTKTVTIEVEGVEFDPARDAFTFTPTLKNATYTATVAAFNLSHGGSKKYTEVPYGAKFSVSETANGLYETSATVNGATYSNGDNITITSDTTIVYTNERKVAEVQIKKVFESKLPQDKNREFKFDYSYVDGSVTHTSQQPASVTVVIPDGANTGSGLSNVIYVPLGAEFKATERQYGELTGDSGVTKTATVSSEKGTTVVFTNKRDVVDLTIKKTVDSTVSSDLNGSYWFNVYYKYVVDGETVEFNEDFEVQVSNGTGSVVVYNVPKAATDLKITERTDKGLIKGVADYITTTGQGVTGATGTFIADERSYTITGITGNVEVNFKNTRQTVTVTVKKEVVSKIDADNTSRPYEFTITTNSTSQTVTIKGAGSATTDVPKGVDVTVTETNADTTVFKVEYKDGGTYQTGSSKTVKNVTADTEFVIKNTRNEFDLTISKTVNNFDASGDNVYPVTYTITYTEGGNTQLIVESTINFTKDDNHRTVKVPYGCKVEVSEDTDVEITINGNKYSISEAFDTKVNDKTTTSHTIDSMKKNEEVNVVNTRKTQTVTVHKVVNNKWNIDADKTAKFEIIVNGTAETIQVSDNRWYKEYTVNYGDAFTAKETEDSAFNTKVGYTYTDNTDNDLTVGNTTSIAHVVKDYDIWFENTRKSVVVKVVKNVVSNDPNDQRTKEFHFNAAFTFGDQDLNSFLVSANDNNFALKNGDSNDITVCYGATLNVQELLTYMDGSGTTIDDSKKYAVTITVGDETVTATEYTINSVESATTITFTNERKAGDLTITKTVTGRSTTDAFVFEITKVNDESFAPLYVTIHPTTDKDDNGYGSITIKQLEAGTYTVRELDNWSWAYTAVSDTEESATEESATEKSATIVGGDQKQVDFTNKDKETNWLRDETSNENSFTNSVSADDTAKSVEAVAWDSKFRLSYAAPVGKFEDKETA